jgi:hypothetical protein
MAMLHGMGFSGFCYQFIYTLKQILDNHVKEMPTLSFLPGIVIEAAKAFSWSPVSPSPSQLQPTDSQGL